MSNKEVFVNRIIEKVSKWGQVNSRLVLLMMLIFFLLSSVLLFICILNFRTHEESYSRFPFVSKRVFLNNPNDIIINFVPLRKALRSYVDAENGKVGVYFEYLPSGVSIGVNATEEVRLASLSKVPLAMSILKKVENGEIKLSDTLHLKEEHLDNRFGEFWKKGVGTPVTIEELIKASLQQSDNTAYQTLYAILSDREVMEVFDNIEIEMTSSSTPIVSPKSFSSIFRSLYLASFLMEEKSNYLLDILTKTDFHDKIPAGVPSGILVAHKIGVFDRVDTLDKVYTDCGIVYEPLRPYILCIFVQDSEDKAIKHMSLISKMVYGYVNLTESRKQ